MRRIFPLLIFLTSATGLVIAPLAGASALQAGGRASVSVIHGLPEFTADVYLDGELLLDGFRPTQATDPLPVAPGTYEVDIREVGASAQSEPALHGTIRLRRDEVVSVVAHIDAQGNPTLSRFSNEFAEVDAGRARLVVRSVADAPSLAVLVDGSKIGAAIEPGGARQEVLPASAHTVRVEGKGTTLVPATDLRLQEGAATVVYVIGSVDDGTIELMTETVRGVHSAPSGVLTGSGGLADDRRPNLFVAALTLVAASLLARRFLARR